jgi:hypothetical protein
MSVKIYPLNKISYFILAVLVVLTGFLTFSIIFKTNTIKKDDINLNTLPEFYNVQKLSVNVVAKNRFSSNYLGSEYDNKPKLVEFYSTNSKTNSEIKSLIKQLIDSGWEITQDLEFAVQQTYMIGELQKNGTIIKIFYFNDLDSIGISGFYNTYNIIGLSPGQSLITLVRI